MATGLSAPDLTGPVSFLRWPTAFGPSRKSPSRKVFSHIRVEVDLRHERLATRGIPVFRQLEALLREQTVVERQDLLRLTALLLHALSTCDFRTVDHWEVHPGGWLPLPEKTHRGDLEPIGHLLRALKSDRWKTVGSAREFAVRLSGAGPNRLDATVRRVHRERGHSITVEVRGRITRRELEQLVGAVRGRLPVLRAVVTDVAYAPLDR